MNMNKLKLSVIVVMLAFGIAACNKPASTESSSSKLDQAPAKAGDKMDKANDKLSEETAKTRTALEDTTVTAKVRIDIMAESSLIGGNITVNTLDGVVTLTGTLDTQENSDKAKKIASDVSGVKSVVNQIVVKP